MSVGIVSMTNKSNIQQYMYVQVHEVVKTIAIDGMSLGITGTKEIKFVDYICLRTGRVVLCRCLFGVYTITNSS